MNPTPENPKLLTRIEIPGPSGFPCVELWHGDMLSWPFDIGVLCVSVTAADFDFYTNHTGPANSRFFIGQLLNQGLDLKRARDESTLRLEDGMGLWVSEPLHPKRGLKPRRVICVHRIGRDKAELTRTFTDVFSSLAILEAHGATLGTVILPLIGAGGMRRPLDLVVPLLVKAARDGMRRLTTLTRIAIVERDDTRAKAIQTAFDDHIGLPRRSVHESELFKLIREDLVEQLTRRISQSSPDDLLYRELLDGLRTNEPSPSVIATAGRKIAERIARQFGKKNADLATRIENLRNHGVPRWVVGYLHLLRQFGNEMVHDHPNQQVRVTHEDLATALVCLLRCLEYLDRRPS